MVFGGTPRAADPAGRLDSAVGALPTRVGGLHARVHQRRRRAAANDASASVATLAGVGTIERGIA